MTGENLMLERFSKIWHLFTYLTIESRDNVFLKLLSWKNSVKSFYLFNGAKYMIHEKNPEDFKRKTILYNITSFLLSPTYFIWFTGVYKKKGKSCFTKPQIDCNNCSDFANSKINENFKY